MSPAGSTAGVVAAAITLLAAVAALAAGLAAAGFDLLQAVGSSVPPQAFLALPYLASLGVLAGAGRAGAPAWLGPPLR